jgi:hypothetical protein
LTRGKIRGEGVFGFRVNHIMPSGARMEGAEGKGVDWSPNVRIFA